MRRRGNVNLDTDRPGSEASRDSDWRAPEMSSNPAQMHLPLVSIQHDLGDAPCTCCPSGAVSLDIRTVPAYGPVEPWSSFAQ